MTEVAELLLLAKMASMLRGSPKVARIISSTKMLRSARSVLALSLSTSAVGEDVLLLLLVVEELLKSGKQGN